MNDPRDEDYFRGYRAHKQHPAMPSTGSEGRCDICGMMPSASVHNKPWEKISVEELRAEQSQGRIPLEREKPAFHNTSYPNRQERLDRIQPAVSSPPGGSSGTMHMKGNALDFTSPKEEPMHTTRAWSSDYIARALFQQDKNWITAAGETVAIEDMRLDHVANTLLMLERVADDLPFDREDLQEQPLYKALYERLMGALTGLDKPGPVLAAEAVPVTGPGLWHNTPQAIRSLLDAAAPAPGRPAKTVRLDYTDGDGWRSERIVEVFGIQDKRGDDAVQPYLVAKNIRKGEMRTYRLDRINRARLMLV